MLNIGKQIKLHRKQLNLSQLELTEKGELSTFDKDLLKRIEDKEKMDSSTKQHLFF